jgi:hypothetical protein
VGTSFEPETSGEALKLTKERHVLGWCEELRDVGLQVRCGLVCRFEDPSTVGGQAYSMGSTVIRVRFAFGVSETFEVINEPDHDVSVDAERVGQLLLSGAVRSCHTVHYCEVTGLNFEWFESLGKQGRDVMPDLGKKEHRPTVEWFEALLGRP